MIHVFSKERMRLLAAALIIAHLVAGFLAPQFHQHAGEDHAETKGVFYHSHLSVIGAEAPESEQNHHDSPGDLHFLEGSSLLEKMQASSAAHLGQAFIPGKFAPPIGLFVSPVVENSPPDSIIKTVLKLPPIQPTRDYFALTATGLSPPLA